MNKLIKSLLLIVFCFTLNTISAQTQSAETTSPTFYFKASLSDFLVPFNSSYVFALEVRMPKYSWQLAAGYINNSLIETIPVTGSDLIEGYRLRLEGRRRLWLNREDQHWLFAGVMVEYLQTNRKGEATFCRQDCQFFQILDYNLSARRAGLHLTFGRVFTGKRFTLEVGGYIGLRMNYETYKDVPDDATFWSEEAFDIINIERDQWVLLPNTGAQVKFGIKLGK